MRRTSTISFVSLLALTAAGCAAPTEGNEEIVGENAAAITNGATYQIRVPGLANKCVDVNANSSANGAVVQLWTCNGSSAQNWVALDKGGGWFALQHQGTNQCLNRDTSSNNSSGGGWVQQYDCQWSGSSEFQWWFDSTNSHIKNRWDAHYLDVTGANSADGTRIETWSYNTSAAQSFNPPGTGGGGGGGGGGSGSKFVGYVVSWKPNIYVPYSKFTHINYAFAIPNADGSLTRAPENPSWLQSVVSGAHGNGGKVLISVGGWMSDSPNPWAFASLAGNSGYRSNFVNNLVNVVNQYGLDGVDIDWEYPCPNNGGNYATLMSDLANAMHSRGKLLTAAVAAFGGNGDCVGTSVFNSVDHLNLMAYDIRDPNHSDYNDAVNSINYWKGKGLAASKAVLGLPYYAHPSWKAYNTKVAENGANRCRDNDGYDFWNGIPTIRAKASYARANAGGVMEWETSQDTTGSDSLTTAAWEAVTGRGGSYGCP
jgi:hypothetical protein